jgi:hypothetical protein
VTVITSVSPTLAAEILGAVPMASRTAVRTASLRMTRISVSTVGAARLSGADSSKTDSVLRGWRTISALAS